MDIFIRFLFKGGTTLWHIKNILKKDGDHREKCKSLLELLYYFEPTDARFVPPMSIMREFIGGSSISY